MSCPLLNLIIPLSCNIIMKVKQVAKQSIQITGMIFQTRSSASFNSASS
ncbi:DUF6783 domain-containing protein [Blautia sp.]